MSIIVYAQKTALLDGAAALLAEQAQVALAERGRWRVALAGGTTPRGVYERLAAEPYRSSIDWQRVDIFWGDERCVAPDNPQSNYRMAWEAWLSHGSIPAQQIHRMRGEDGSDAAARAYAATLRKVFGLVKLDESASAQAAEDGPDGGMWPVFDTVLLGMGADGHTASLFPNSSLLRERDTLVAAGWVEQQQQERLSLTLPVLNAARSVVFLVAGADKAPVVAAILRDGSDQYPAALVQPTLPATWLLDEGAATKLSERD